MDSNYFFHLPLQQYSRRAQPGTRRKVNTTVKKFKIVTLTLTFVLLFLILNLQTLVYVLQEFIVGDNFNVKLCYHFDENDDSKRSEAMPKVIHQIDLGFDDDSDIVDIKRYCQKTWKERNRDYEYILWNTSTIEDLINRCYMELRPLYERYRGNAKVMKDIASYIVVHNKGGVFVDNDLVCRQSVRELHTVMGTNTVMLSYTESPFGISNKIFMANKGHEFMTHVLDGLENGKIFYLASFTKSTPSTGSAFLSGRYLSYPHKDEVFLLPSSSEYVQRIVFRENW